MIHSWSLQQSCNTVSTYLIISIHTSSSSTHLQTVGFYHLHKRELYLYNRAKSYWKWKCPNMMILGCGSVHRLPIFSFIVGRPKHPKLVHHNFIATVLNDVFGIQARGGCACAGPYGEASYACYSDSVKPHTYRFIILHWVAYAVVLLGYTK